MISVTSREKTSNLSLETSLDDAGVTWYMIPPVTPPAKPQKPPCLAKVHDISFILISRLVFSRDCRTCFAQPGTETACGKQRAGSGRSRNHRRYLVRALKSMTAKKILMPAPVFTDLFVGHFLGCNTIFYHDGPYTGIPSIPHFFLPFLSNGLVNT